ncbi:MAG: FecR domain-containing protein [Tannerellaceae bacterium]|jgi:ferric-dicitrate binding protein FerR (iron transport regulator)|nr:FecR domain-containing protein [Tannerellaceae bacterium]
MEIYILLQRYIEGDATVDEKQQVLHWLQEDESHIMEYQSMRKLHDLHNWNTDHRKEVAGPVRQALLRRKVITEVMKVAAVLLVGILSAYIFLRPEEAAPSLQTIYVPHGQRAELFLSDGTGIWLNSGTRLTFPTIFANKTREISLDGEGYFKVAKDQSKPFIVHAGRYDVNVLGTEFNVKSYIKNNYFEVSLLEGSVNIESKDQPSLRLMPNETAYLSDGRLTKGAINDFNYFKWREGLICFEKENLASLFKKLELYYDIQIVTNNEQLAGWSYTGKFRTRDGIEHVLRVLQLRHDFQYTKDEANNIIIIN